jgi:UDP-N-acetylglucosamine acyltransferase
MSNNINSSSIIDPKARLGKNVTIGPFCIVGPEVTLGDNVELKSHVVVEGITTIGEGTTIFPFASIGHVNQDLKYEGEKSEVIIGKNNTIREYVTIQPGTKGGIMKTVVGDNNLLMVGVHVAHDCVVGSGCILANCATLAGHVQVGDGAVIGGLAAVRQWVRIGSGAMVGGLSGVTQDVLPYTTVANERAAIDGVNIVGMKRRGFGLEDVRSVQEAVGKLFFNSGTMDERVQNIRESIDKSSPVHSLLDFVEAQKTKLGYCSPRGMNLQ